MAESMDNLCPVRFLWRMNMYPPASRTALVALRIAFPVGRYAPVAPSSYSMLPG